MSGDKNVLLLTTLHDKKNHLFELEPKVQNRSDLILIHDSPQCHKYIHTKSEGTGAFNKTKQFVVGQSCVMKVSEGFYLFFLFNAKSAIFHLYYYYMANLDERDAEKEQYKVSQYISLQGRADIIN